ncbi:MAG: glycosyltransferase [Bacteroidaceae bacterium]|nr:glycosyltransferase [Bacteroidaceae bacterium]
MKIAILHSAAAGFFPRFYGLLHNAITEEGESCRLFLPNIRTNRASALPDSVVWGTRFNTVIHKWLYRMTGIQDVFSVFDTGCLIRQLKLYNPDIIHCHIINDRCLNIRMLRSYANRHDIPVVWTMHDCRAVTGRCAYFDEIGCERWKTGCGKCPQKVLYSPTFLDNSHLEWIIRKRVLTGFKSLTIVTPSNWLADIISNSYLKEYETVVINNGIDIQTFSDHASFDDKNPDKRKIVLGVAHAWEARKGLDLFIRLSHDLPDSYRVMLVGHLPYTIENITSVAPTSSAGELASIYAGASVFVNPTIADNFPTTNLESLASGTPVVTFQTGGSPESIDDTCGIAVKKNDYDALKKAIEHVADNRNCYTSESCRKRAALFSQKQYRLYVQLFRRILKDKGQSAL